MGGRLATKATATRMSRFPLRVARCTASSSRKSMSPRWGDSAKPCGRKPQGMVALRALSAHWLPRGTCGKEMWEGRGCGLRSLGAAGEERAGWNLEGRRE